jgi:hypothetical protein
VSFLSQR